MFDGVKEIYDSLIESNDLPRQFCGNWEDDKKQFAFEYTRNNLIFLEDGFGSDDELYDLD